MGSLPIEGRKGNCGKLTDVLDHQLRVGGQDVSEQLIAAYTERGLTPPDHLLDPPTILTENFLYWEAYRDLITERRQPRGMIPVGAIVSYAIVYGLNPDTLKRIVWEVDRVLTDHWKDLDAADKAQAGKSIEYKPSLPGGQS